MNNLNNISEYQKIIFVNGLDENNAELQPNGGIRSLSNNYPFVVFITKNNELKELLRYPVTNMWFDGTRLTRFIGVDKAHNSITVGDHVYKLNFNYETGLLGLYSENILESLEIIYVEYTDIYNSIQQYSNNSTFMIDAKDNKFKIRFKYKIQSNLTENFDIRTISKALSYNSNYITNISGRSIEVSNDLLEEIYEITYNVTKSTEGTSKNILFASEYSPEITCASYEKLYLNPISYNIVINGQVINDVTYLEKDKIYIVTLSFNPSNLSSQSYHRIYVDAESNNGLQILNNDDTKQLVNGICEFTIKTPSNVAVNTISNSILSFNVKRMLNNETAWTVYPYLSKSITISVQGDQSNKYFYFGYEDPRSNTSLLKSYANIEIGTYIWEGNEIHNNESESYYTGKYFYCAIPMDYSSIIYPRWEAWTGSSNNLLKCKEWFNILNENLELNGIRYIIYRRIKPGKFYGRIK